jgi:hypothetical protein
LTAGYWPPLTPCGTRISLLTAVSLEAKDPGSTSDREGAMAIFEGPDRNRNIMIAVAVVVVILVIIYLYA